jgi:hypothetical protein
MKAIQVQTNTPTEKGSYSFHGTGLVFCSPCCGNTFFVEVPIAERSPLTVGPLTCPCCSKDFVVTHGEIGFTGAVVSAKPIAESVVLPKLKTEVEKA